MCWCSVAGAFSAYFETEIKVTILLILYWSQYSSFYIFLHAGRHIFDTLTWLTSLPGKLGLHIVSRVAVLNSFAPFKDTLFTCALSSSAEANSEQRKCAFSLAERGREIPPHGCTGTPPPGLDQFLTSRLGVCAAAVINARHFPPPSPPICISQAIPRLRRLFTRGAVNRPLRLPVIAPSIQPR